jgi:hypothetical protein
MPCSLQLYPIFNFVIRVASISMKRYHPISYQGYFRTISYYGNQGSKRFVYKTTLLSSLLE